VKLGRPKIEYAWRTALFPSKGPLDDAAGKPIENSSRSFQTSAFPFLFGRKSRQSTILFLVYNLFITCVAAYQATAQINL
jgi:hypothetical protein